jgi:uncharacterized membrane-anchored protein
MLWSIKVLATTIGETGADYPAVHGGLGAVINGAITTVLLVLALGWQTATTLLRMSSLPQVFFTTQELSACCSRPHHHAALHG